jgi:hypothetical protein
MRPRPSPTVLLQGVKEMLLEALIGFTSSVIINFLTSVFKIEEVEE